MEDKFAIIVKTYFGLEEVLAKELKALGVTEYEVLNRAIRFEGNKEMMYKCNLHLRTAVRVIKPIQTFYIKDEQDLYDKVQRIDWSQYMDNSSTFAISGTTNSNYFTHSKFVALKAKDAIVDQFRDKTGERPSVDPQEPDVAIDLYIFNHSCTISLDSTGESLSKRGYRHRQTEAPINEALAAGIIQLTNWDKKTPLVDPMCGSGTFAIEAALMAKNIAPGRLRSFCFENWNDFDEDLWDKIYEEAEDAITDEPCFIHASDQDREAIEISQDNADSAGVSACITFQNMDMMKTTSPDQPGTIVINPPYGERLNNPDDIIPLYQEMGTHMKHSYEGYDAWIISSNLRALKFVGLKPSKKIPLYNGSLECRLNKFELYRGSKKIEPKAD